MKKILGVAVVVLLLLAGGVLGLRSWLGTDATTASAERSASERVVPTRSPRAEASVSASASPSASASASPSPTPSRTPSPSPSPTPTRTTAPPAAPAPVATRSVRSTAAVASQVKASLDAQGRRTVVGCPSTVPAAVGTRFSCTVAYASAPSIIVADAVVRITSSDGTFTWRSVPRG